MECFVFCVLIVVDVDVIIVVCQDFEILWWMLVLSLYICVDGEGFVLLVVQWWESDSQVVWVVFVDGVLVGMVGLYYIMLYDVGGQVELGYWMVVEVCGKGYIVEVVCVVIDWGFGEFGFVCI